MTRRNRDPTPPPPDDEPRYLTVVHPYPLNANLELHADRRTLALWLACCTGKDVLLAMFHKPASPGMVLIEVDRNFDSFHRLLGSHAWSEFLQKPSKEELEKVSKVFGCTYNTGRKVEKHGWKRVNIKDDWFNGWRRKNDVIRHPYPKTTYCDVPFEAKTGAPMCLPLSQKTFLDQEDWSISRDAREGTDTQSVASSSRRTSNSVSGSDDEGDYADDEGDYADEDDGLSLARTNTNTNTTSGGSRTGSSSDARSTTSLNPNIAENVWPSESGLSSQPPSISAAGGGSDNGRRSGTRPTTRSDERSSVSSSSARGQPTSSTTASSGFPTFADTHWGDPIAMAMADLAKEGKRGRQEDGTSTDEEGPDPSGQNESQSARKRKNKAKSELVQAQATQASVLEEALLGVQLPPGGPGSSWGDPNEPPW